MRTTHFSFILITRAGCCRFCHNAVSALFCVLYFFSGHKNTLFWSDYSSWGCKGLFSCFLFPGSIIFFGRENDQLLLILNSIKQLVGDLLSVILNFLRIIGFTPAVILLKGTLSFSLYSSLSLSLSLFINLFIDFISSDLLKHG